MAIERASRLVACLHSGGGSLDTTTAGIRSDQAERSVRVEERGVSSVADVVVVWAALVRVLRLILEVVDGRRPVGRLEAVVMASVLRYVRAAQNTRSAQAGRRGSGADVLPGRAASAAGLASGTIG